MLIVNLKTKHKPNERARTGKDLCLTTMPKSQNNQMATGLESTLKALQQPVVSQKAQLTKILPTMFEADLVQTSL